MAMATSSATPLTIPWATIDAAITRVDLTSRAAIQPVPVDEPRMVPLLEFLTAPDAALADTPFAPWRTTRPAQFFRLPPFMLVLPHCCDLALLTIDDLLRSPTLQGISIGGTIWCFSRTQDLPLPVAQMLMAGLREGWAIPVRPLTPSSQPTPPAVTPPLYPQPPRVGGPETIDWSAFVANRQTRWCRPLQPVIHLEDPEHAWLAHYPELLAFLKTHGTYLEPEDMRLLCGFIHQLTTPFAGVVTADQIATLTKLIQGVLGEIGHRRTVLDELETLRTRGYHNAIMLTEREISSPRGRAASDAVIGVVDIVLKQLTLLAAFEITSTTDCGTAPSQMERSLLSRYRRYGITITSADGTFGTLAVQYPADTKAWIGMYAVAGHAALAEIASQTVERALRFTPLWIAAAQPTRRLPPELIEAGIELLQELFTDWRTYGVQWSAPLVDVALAQLAVEYKSLLPFFGRLIPIFQNMYGLLGGSRQTYEEVARVAHAPHALIHRLEAMLRTGLTPLGVREAPIEDLAMARRVAEAELFALSQRLQTERAAGAVLDIVGLGLAVYGIMDATPASARIWPSVWWILLCPAGDWGAGVDHSAYDGEAHSHTIYRSQGPVRLWKERLQAWFDTVGLPDLVSTREQRALFWQIDYRTMRVMADLVHWGATMHTSSSPEPTAADVEAALQAWLLGRGVAPDLAHDILLLFHGIYCGIPPGVTARKPDEHGYPAYRYFPYRTLQQWQFPPDCRMTEPWGLALQAAFPWLPASLDSWPHESLVRQTTTHLQAALRELLPQAPAATPLTWPTFFHSLGQHCREWSVSRYQFDGEMQHGDAIQQPRRIHSTSGTAIWNLGLMLTARAVWDPDDRWRRLDILPLVERMTGIKIPAEFATLWREVLTTNFPLPPHTR